MLIKMEHHALLLCELATTRSPQNSDVMTTWTCTYTVALKSSSLARAEQSGVSQMSQVTDLPHRFLGRALSPGCLVNKLSVNYLIRQKVFNKATTQEP